MGKLKRTTMIIRIIFIATIFTILMLQLNGVVNPTTALITAVICAAVFLSAITFLQLKMNQKQQAIITLMSGFFIIVLSIILVNI